MTTTVVVAHSPTSKTRRNVEISVAETDETPQRCQPKICRRYVTYVESASRPEARMTVGNCVAAYILRRLATYCVVPRGGGVRTPTYELFAESEYVN